MSKGKKFFAFIALAAIAGVAATAAEAGACVKKGAVGTAGSEKDAQFQVDEALLQAVDWGAWAAWMATGKTPGYSFGPRTYKCSKGGTFGWTCRGSATICKL